MANAPIFIAYIRELIAEDDFKTAIQQLSALLKDSPQLDEVVQQSARYNHLMHQIRLGLVDFQAANITQNQIRFGVLELLRELEHPISLSIQAEVEQFAVKMEKNLEAQAKLGQSAITIKKNTVTDSTITAGGNVTIGDTVQTESKISQHLRLFLFGFVPVLAISCAWLYHKNQKLSEPLHLTVQVTDATPNPNIPFEKAKVTLTYGDKTESQTIEKEATFKGIPPHFRDDMLQIQCEANGFVTVQRLFEFSENKVTIPLCRDHSLATLFGQIKSEKGEGLAEVQVSVQDITVLSNASGFYSLTIPFEKQRVAQRLRAFKSGFKLWDFETPVLSSTPVDIILKK
jgi:Effector-associated domain 11